MRFTVLVVLACLTLALGCNKKTSPAATLPADVKMVADGASVDLARGETAVLEKQKQGITFLSVASDNRCPEGVNCITAGEASVVVALGGGAPQTVKVEPDPKKITRLTIGETTVEILRLDPYPRARVKTDPALIRLRVRLRSSARK